MAKASGGTRYQSPKTITRSAVGASFSPSEQGMRKAAGRSNSMYTNLQSLASETGGRTDVTGRGVTWSYQNGNVTNAAIEVVNTFTKNGRPKVSYETRITGYKTPVGYDSESPYGKQVRRVKTYNSLETAYKGLQQQVRGANRYKAGS